MRQAVIVAFLTGAVGLASPSSATASQHELATVRIAHDVLAGGQPLPAGTYQLKLTGEHPTPQPGQSREARQWVELVSGGSVVAREVAEVLRDGDRPAIGASSRPVDPGVRVELLKSGEFVRVSVKREGVRYLVYLPVAHE